MPNNSMIILAGGKNSRMKKDKAFLMVKQKRLIDQTVTMAKDFFPEIIIVTNNPSAYQYLDVVITSDRITGQGPLAGIHAGLIEASFDNSFVVACDMPFINMKLGLSMAKEALGYDVVVPVTDKGLQPLHAVYGKNCIPVIESCLNQGIRKTIAIYEMLKVKMIGEEQLQKWGVSAWCFYNVNTPQELEIAQLAAKELKEND